VSDKAFPGRWVQVARLLSRRLAVAVPVTLVLTALVFALASVAPFNPLATYLGSSYTHTNPELREQLSSQLGFDKPWAQVWTQWISHALRGDLGVSISTSQPVTSVLLERIPYTLLLTSVGLLLAIVIALILALLAATYQYGFIDRVVQAIGHLAQSIPVFVIALVAITLIALPLGWPTSGVAAAGMDPTMTSVATHLLLPATVLAISLLPWLLLNLRTSLFEALDTDAVLAARGRGSRYILLTEALPQALLPFITVVGSRLGELITGALLIETIFSWPGIASAVVGSAVAGDFALLAAVTVCSALAVFAGNALADAAYLLIDPRVTHV